MADAPAPPPPRSPGPRLVPTRRTPEPMERNPYAPPRAELAREAVEDPGEWRDWGEVVPALHGLVWIRDAFRLFLERPWTWLGAFFLCFLFTELENLISVDGGWVDKELGLLLNAVFFFGIVPMAHEQSEGGDIRVMDIFGALRPRILVQAVVVGAIASLLMYALGHMVSFLRSTPIIARNPDPTVRMFLLLSLLGGAQYCHIVLCLFFSPTLAAVAGRGVPGALLTGMVAVFRNWKAFLVNFFLLAFFFWCLFAGWTILVPMFKAATAGVGGSLRVVCHYVPVFIGATAYVFFFNYLFILMSYAASRDIFYEEG